MCRSTQGMVLVMESLDRRPGNGRTGKENHGTVDTRLFLGRHSHREELVTCIQAH